MVQPMDYTLNVASPFARAVEGMDAGLRVQQGARQEQLAQSALRTEEQMMGLRASQEQRAQAAFGMDQQVFAQQQAALQAQQERAQAAQQALVQLAETPNAGSREYADLILRFPEFAEETQQAFQLMDSDQRQRTLTDALQVYTALSGGNTGAAQALLERRLEAAEASEDEEAAQAARASLEVLDMDPDALRTSLGVQIKAVGGNEYDEILERPRVQSTVSVGPRLSVQTMNTGETRVVDATTNEVLRGEEAANAIREAEQAQAAQLEAEAFGRGIGAETVAIGREALDSLASVRSTVSNIDTAIQAIDDGAASGVIASYFPNVTRASAELENAMNRLGLDVIGSVTFGALSEGEMRLAMETAVPRGLRPEALRQWFVDKRDAQTKAAAALQNAARVLMTEGDLGAYIESQGVAPRQEQPQAPTAPPAAPPATGRAPEVDSFFQNLRPPAGGAVRLENR